jgi:putative MFS transporter
MNTHVSFEDLPLSRFHIRTVFSGTGGQFSDGFVLGIIGIAVSMAAGPLQLNALWMGLLGAASLAGLFVGSLVAGPLADKFGRRTIFAWDMLLFAVISASQFFVSSPEQLLALRLLLGLVLGFDYVVSKSLVTEFAPRRYRGRLLSVLAAAWAAGYVAAYLVGFAIRDVGPDAWRIMLAVSGIPALLILPLRMGVPESPIWLMARGRTEEAQAIVHSKFGPNVHLPQPKNTQIKKRGSFSELFSPRWRKNTIVGCVFYTCQVIPFFALGTFSPRVLEALNVQDKFVGGLAYAGFGPVGTILAFGFFACVMAAAVNLEFVYPPELFPTHLRASGIGMAVASSRFGSAFATFLLPIAVQNFGIQTALGVCVAVLLLGGIVCHFMAPETSKDELSSVHPEHSETDLIVASVGGLDQK